MFHSFIQMSDQQLVLLLNTLALEPWNGARVLDVTDVTNGDSW